MVAELKVQLVRNAAMCTRVELALQVTELEAQLAQSRADAEELRRQAASEAAAAAEILDMAESAAQKLGQQLLALMAQREAMTSSAAAGAAAAGAGVSTSQMQEAIKEVRRGPPLREGGIL